GRSDQTNFGGRVYIDFGPFPLSGVQPASAGVLMPLMQGSSSNRLMPVGGEQRQLNGDARRTGSRRAHFRYVATGESGTNFSKRGCAHLSLASAHARRRVTFERLHIVETFRDGLAQIILGHVLAEADKAFALIGIKMGHDAVAAGRRGFGQENGPILTESFQVLDGIAESGGRLAASELAFEHLRG